MKAVYTSNDIIRFFTCEFYPILFEIPTMLVNNLDNMQARATLSFSEVSFIKLTELYAHVILIARTKLTN